MYAIRSYYVKDNGALQRDDASTCLERWRGGEGRYWIDIENPTPEEQVRWLSPLNLSPLVLHCCRELGQHTRVVPLRDEVFLDRITSYNVCYTKLLRPELRQRF